VLHLFTCTFWVSGRGITVSGPLQSTSQPRNVYNLINICIQAGVVAQARCSPAPLLDHRRMRLMWFSRAHRSSTSCTVSQTRLAKECTKPVDSHAAWIAVARYWPLPWSCSGVAGFGAYLDFPSLLHLRHLSRHTLCTWHIPDMHVTTQPAPCAKDELCCIALITLRLAPLIEAQQIQVALGWPADFNVGRLAAFCSSLARFFAAPFS